MEIKIVIEATELSNAILALAGAIAGQTATQTQPTPPAPAPRSRARATTAPVAEEVKTEVLDIAEIIAKAIQ